MGMKVNGTSGLTFPDTTTLGSAGQSSVQAWVNFNGTGTVAIRANFNVASITDNGVGDYTVNFTTAMPDTNYSVVGTTMRNFGGGPAGLAQIIFSVRNSTTYSDAYSTTSVSVSTIAADSGGSALDPLAVNVAIFR